MASEFSEPKPKPIAAKKISEVRGAGRILFGGTWERGGLPESSVVLAVVCTAMSKEVDGAEDRWRRSSHDLPSLLGESTCTTLSESWHFVVSPKLAGFVGAWLMIVPSLLIERPRREELGAEGASSELCAGESKDLLAVSEFLLLVEKAAQASPLPLGFSLLHLNLPSPSRVLPPTFRIL
jgi:hypothetical protein